MTNLEAIRSKLNYPLSDSAFELALTDRGLLASAEYSGGTGFQLAYADAIMTLITTPDVKEGGYSISLTDKDRLEKLAQGIYQRHGESGVIPRPAARFVQRW